MTKSNTDKKACLSCRHFKYCRVYWGVNCKRQGGTRIPRMKSLARVEKERQLEQQKSQKLIATGKQFIDLFGPIITRVANW